jgi:hypothetical protein
MMSFSLSYKSAQDIISSCTENADFGKYDQTPNKSYHATLPTEA